MVGGGRVHKSFESSQGDNNSPIHNSRAGGSEKVRGENIKTFSNSRGGGFENVFKFPGEGAYLNRGELENTGALV